MAIFLAKLGHVSRLDWRFFLRLYTCQNLVASAVCEWGTASGEWAGWRQASGGVALREAGGADAWNRAAGRDSSSAWDRAGFGIGAVVDGWNGRLTRGGGADSSDGDKWHTEGRDRFWGSWASGPGLLFLGLRLGLVFWAISLQKCHFSFSSSKSSFFFTFFLFNFLNTKIHN